MMLMGFPMGEVAINTVSDSVGLTCFAFVFFTFFSHAHDLPGLFQDLSKMAGNAMHLRAVGVALCAAFKAKEKFKKNIIII